ncbi:Outer membrane autotransporter barrel [Chlorobium ferrooxidans DSM 13031]|uniref:Outer membrane autotransporter barrel n=1 Tax=Chlorobium ferrooxidans DSM 13031 TaxID=377431 RepID=Q0YV05_9CHLB|nr:Outer membrane autotransporter barrel [Chlorobium ferrooxidans DSM 13031]
MYLFLLLTIAGVPLRAGAADWRTLTQPVGTQNTPFLVDPALLNAGYAAGRGPWALTTSVTSITTTTPQFFIRFYNPSASSNASGQEGSWVMRISSVRGLSAQKIRNFFALPNTPSMMTLGLSVTGESFYTGLAGPIEGWGDGGGQQSQANGGPYTIFFNAQPVPEAVLYWPDMADTDNSRAVATYLAGDTPAAYSDMESVYNTLDVLCNPASRDLFNSALGTLTAQRFDNLASSAYYAVELHNQAIDDRIDRFAVRSSMPGFWIKAARSFQHSPDSGYDGDINAMILGFDQKSSDRTLSGISLAWMHGSVYWADNGGQAVTDYYRAAAYSAVVIDRAFLQGEVSVGSTADETSRNITIGTLYLPSPHGPLLSPLSGIARTATADYKGWNADIGLRAGVLVNAGMLNIRPSFGFGWLYQSRNSFTETGAESLNLTVAAAHTETLHCRADVRFERAITMHEQKTITPYVVIGWACAGRLDAQEVRASMNGRSDSFTTSSATGGAQMFTGRAGIETALSKELFFVAECFRQAQSGDRQSGFALAMNYLF